MPRAWIEVEWQEQPGVDACPPAARGLVGEACEMLLGGLVDAGVPDAAVTLTFGVPDASEVQLG